MPKQANSLFNNDYNYFFLGLASRKWSLSLSPFVAQNAGDVLWAMMVYFGFRFLLVRKSTLTAIVLSFLFCFSIEFSQLYQEDWINQIRATMLGSLILGKGFSYRGFNSIYSRDTNRRCLR